MHSTRLRLLALVAVAALVSTACGGDNGTGTPEASEASTIPGAGTTAPADVETTEASKAEGSNTNVDLGFAQPNATVVFRVDGAAAGKNYTGDPFEFRVSQTWDAGDTESVVAVGQFIQGWFHDRLVICIGADTDTPECVSSPPDALVLQSSLGAVPQFGPAAPLFDQYLLTFEAWETQDGAGELELVDGPVSAGGLAPLLVCVDAPFDGRTDRRCDFDGGGAGTLDQDADGTLEIELLSYEGVTDADMSFPVDVVDNPARFIEILQADVPQLS